MYALVIMDSTHLTEYSSGKDWARDDDKYPST